MNTFAKTFIAIAAMSASQGAMPLPASAAPDHRAAIHRTNDRQDMRHSTDFRDRLQNMRQQINAGERNRQLSHREAVRLTGKVNELERLKRNYERTGRGIDAQEAASLNARADVISAQIRAQGHDRNRW